MRLQRGLPFVFALLCLLGCSKRAKDPHLSIDMTPQAIDPMSMAGAFGQLDAAAIAERCGPAVVVIVGAQKQGSGVILADRQLVATNAHVIQDEAALVVKLRDGRSVPGVAVAVDEHLDLALLALPPGTYPVAELGDSNALRAGERVVAIGAPLGLEQSVSTGEIAALRDVDGVRILQISVPISPGSSGGGLFDRNGKLVGITTASLKRGQNLNFAMPTSSVRTLLARVPGR